VSGSGLVDPIEALIRIIRSNVFGYVREDLEGIYSQILVDGREVEKYLKGSL
jgi:hypothetical protein